MGEVKARNALFDAISAAFDESQDADAARITEAVCTLIDERIAAARLKHDAEWRLEPGEEKF